MISCDDELKQVVSCDIDDQIVQCYDVNIPNTNKYTKLVDCFKERFLFLDKLSNCLYF